MGARSLILVTVLALAACRAAAPPPEAASERAAAAGGAASAPAASKPPQVAEAAAPPVGAAPQLGDSVKAGMAYADFRKAVAGQGWTPVRDPQCAVNVVGDNHDALCAENPELALCKACNDMPELESCSADGYCVMNFSQPARAHALRVVSYGMTEDWNVSGEDSRLQVSSWELSAAGK